MKRVIILFAVLVCGFCRQTAPIPQPTPLVAGLMRVNFSPRGGCTKAVVDEIECATSEVKVQAYSFTSKPIAEALIAAHKRGVKIEVCADDSNKNPDTSIVDDLAEAGIPVWLDGKHAIAHSKVVIVDKRVVLTGSFNLTAAGEKSNLENLLTIHSAELAVWYLKNFSEHKAHCVRLEQ